MCARDDDSRRVRINPFVSFGKPVIAGTGISMAIIAERSYAGESVRELSRDYGVSSENIEEAVRQKASSPPAGRSATRSANSSRYERFFP